MQRHLDPDQAVLYTQSFGGGGAAVGLLLGPLGVLANIKAIETRTDADMLVLKGQVDPRPVILFKEAAKAQGWPLLEGAPTAGHPQVTPYVLVVKVEEDRVMVAAVVLIEQGDPLARWQYTYVLRGRHSLKQLAELSQPEKERLRDEVRTGYANVIAFMESQTGSGLAQEKKVSFESRFVTPMYSGEIPGTLAHEAEGRLWLRSGTAVWALPQDEVKVVPR